MADAAPPAPNPGLRTRFTDSLKAAMKGGDQPAVSTLRMVLAKLKDTDIASRDPSKPSAMMQVDEGAIVSMLRGMIKSRRDSVELYTRGNRPELAAKELSEIALIETFLPAQMDEAALAAAVDAAITETGATTVKEMGKVMAALKSRHGAVLDMAKVNPLVKARLA